MRHAGKLLEEHVTTVSDALLLRREDLRELRFSIGETNRLLGQIENMKRRQAPEERKRDPALQGGLAGFFVDADDDFEESQPIRKKRHPERNLGKRRMSRHHHRHHKEDLVDEFNVNSQQLLLDAIEDSRLDQWKYEARMRQQKGHREVQQERMKNRWQKRHRRRHRRQEPEDDGFVQALVSKCKEFKDRVVPRRYSVPEAYLHDRKHRLNFDFHNSRNKPQRVVFRRYDKSDRKERKRRVVVPPPFDLNLLDAQHESVLPHAI